MPSGATAREVTVVSLKGFIVFDFLQVACLVASTRVRAIWTRVGMKKEEEFLKSCIEDPFGPLFSGVREFTPVKIVQDMSRFPADTSRPVNAVSGVSGAFSR